jgi:hypothetical protein
MSMLTEQKLAVEREAERVLVRFFHHLDTGEFEALVALMAEDGVWHRQGKVLRGPGMVREALAERPKGRRTRHLVTNLIVDAVDERHVQAIYYLTVFRHDGVTPGEPAPIELPASVGTYREKLVLTPAGWRVAEITSEGAFRR